MAGKTGDGKSVKTLPIQIPAETAVVLYPTFRTSFSHFRNIALHNALPATSAKRHGIGSNSGQARLFVQ
ncbi:MAG: hypothetical protein GY807_20265 [Gammaproteobacteria bacterium]|nr:hypothetical protein [Gammaproteobacteria bacterium]